MLIRGGGGGGGSKRKASGMTDIIRQNENVYMKNEENVLYYSSVHSFKKILYLEIVPLWFKNRNERVHIGQLMRSRGGGEGLYKC